MGVKKVLAATAAVLLIAAGAAGGVGYHYYEKYIDIDTIYPGISVEGIDLSGDTYDTAKEKIDTYVEELKGQEFIFTFDKKKKKLPVSAIGFDSDNAQQALDQAYQTGREGNIIDRAKTVYNLMTDQVEYDLTFSVDEDLMKQKIKKKLKGWNAEVKDASITRKDGKFVVTPDVSGVVVHADEAIDQALKLIHDEAWNTEGITIDVNCDVTPAEHTKAELDQIKDVLGTYKTTYYDSSWGRCKNVENGASKINGTLLYPGDSFSVYGCVAPFNKDTGYELAGSYLNGQVIQTYGGGICQVSTTLYNAVIRAELKVTERHPHSMTVHYVPLSADAAISGTEKDLKFTNNLDCPVYIEGVAGDRVISFTIYGKETRPKNRSVSFESQTTATIEPPVKQEKDPTLEKGKIQIDQKGVTGYRAKLYKIVTVDGEVQDRSVFNESSYMAVKQIERVGTMEKKKGDKNKNKTPGRNDKKQDDNSNNKTESDQ